VRSEAVAIVILMRLPAAFFLMSIQHALLTSLLEKPSSGYELARRFDKSMGYFWSATHQQIYRELGRMAEAGWVSMEEEEDGRKKTYTVLPPGREELARWVLEPTVSSDNREEVLVKLRAEAVIGPLGFIDEMQRLIEQHRTRLNTFREIEQRDFSAPDLTRAQRLQLAVLQRGIVYEEGWLAWADDVLPLLEPASVTA
jgi:DNA-binding PadR family transcriptional regulator